MLRSPPLTLLTLAGLLAAGGCTAHRPTVTQKPAAAEELSFRGKSFGSQPDPWMKPLPGAASVRDAGLVSYVNPVDDASVGDIDMEAIRYDYWNGALYEIEISKGGLPTEESAVGLAAKLQRALTIWSQGRPSDWTTSEVRRKEKAWDSAETVDLYGETMSMVTGRIEVRIDTEDRRGSKAATYEVNVRLRDRERIRDLLSRLQPAP